MSFLVSSLIEKGLTSPLVFTPKAAPLLTNKRRYIGETYRRG